MSDLNQETENFCYINGRLIRTLKEYVFLKKKLVIYNMLTS